MSDIRDHRYGIKYILLVLTLNGLSPFAFTYERSVLSVRTPRKLFIYSVVVSIVLNIFIICSTIYYEYDYYYQNQNDDVVFLLVTLEYFFGITNGMVLFTLHNHHHVKIAKLVNQAMKLNKIINKFAPPVTVFNKRIKKIIGIKVVTVVSQILTSFLSSYSTSFFGWAIYAYPQLTDDCHIYFWINGFELKFNNLHQLKT